MILRIFTGEVPRKRYQSKSEFWLAFGLKIPGLSQSRQEKGSCLNGTNLRRNPFSQQGFNQFRSECARACVRTESSFYHTDEIWEVDAAFLSLIAHGYDNAGRESLTM